MDYMKPFLLWILDHPVTWPVLIVGGMFIHASWLRFYRASHLALAGAESSVSIPSPSPDKGTKPSHNVRFIEFKKIQIDQDFPELALATLGFENVLVPGRYIDDFHFARLQVNYSDFSTGDAIAEVFLARWHDSPAAPIDIVAGSKHYAVIASCIGCKWATDALVDTPINPALEYGFGGSEFTHESVPLPLGRIKIRATLIGARNVSITPVEGILTLGQDGSASFTSLPST